MRHEVPLHRLPGETSKAFAALMAYAQMPAAERSTRRVADKLGKSVSLIQRWSRQHLWVRRTEQYDRHMQRIHLRAQARAREEMAERHAKLAAAFLGKLVARLQSMSPDDLSPRDMAYWLDVASKVERMARGEPDKHTLEVTGKDGGPVEFSTLDESKQRERLQQLIAEANKRLDEATEAEPTA